MPGFHSDFDDEGGDFFNDASTDGSSTDNQPLGELKALDTASINALFTDLAKKQRDEFADYHPAFEKLQSLVRQMQAGGMPFISLELAGIQAFRDLDISSSGLKQPHALLKIDEVTLLVRINNDSTVDIHSVNLNKPEPLRQLADFWKATLKGEVGYHHYDLTQETASLALVEAVAQIGALCSAYNEMKKYETTSGNELNLIKTRSFNKKP